MKRRKSTVIYDPHSSKFEVYVGAQLQRLGYHPYHNLDIPVDDEVPIRNVDYAFPLDKKPSTPDRKRYHIIQLDHPGVHKGKQIDKDEKTDELLRAKGHIVTRIPYKSDSPNEVKRVVNLIIKTVKRYELCLDLANGLLNKARKT